METTIKIFRQIMATALICAGFSATAQRSAIQYFRPNNKEGLNIFETTKKDSVAFKGLHVKVGGNFAQDFQGLKHQNNATPVIVGGVNTNQLIQLTDAFNLAMANLNIDAQLADGVRLNLTTYLSTRHHQDAWVKGGYIQIDKLPFIKSNTLDNLMKYITIKIGDFEVDYGDQHYRRTDGGNVIYNPFVENYIMDEFATEIGGEIYYHSNKGIFVMGGISDGELDPTVVKSSAVDAATGRQNHYAPAFHGKLGFDKQLNDDARLRITCSFYEDKSSAGNTLFFGDRTGSHYFLVMENSASDPVDNAWSGRVNPSFREQVTTFMINPFLKYKGFEVFGTGEFAKGRSITEQNMRHATQYAVDAVYRFPAAKENFWIGARYNTVNAALPGNPGNVTLNREVGSVGWFLTKNIMLKAEYVTQEYKDFAATDIRSGGKFNGVMIEAAVGF